MRLIVLASGSTGNALYIESGSTCVLVDAGLSGKEAGRRMNEAGLDITRLSAIVVTHEHSDHIQGVRVISKTAKVPVYISEATRVECRFQQDGEGIRWGETITSSEPFRIGTMDFSPFSIPHDSVDPFALTIEADGIKAGIVTDLGYITQLVSHELLDSDLIVIESNHDLEMLKAGPYPWPLKQRIASRLGHLSNNETARWIREEFDGKAEYLVLAHLSLQCNHPEIARLSALEALANREGAFFHDAERRIRVAHHDRPSDWIEL